MDSLPESWPDIYYVQNIFLTRLPAFFIDAPSIFFTDSLIPAGISAVFPGT